MHSSIAVQFDDDSWHYVLGMSWRHEDKKPSKARLRELAQNQGRWGLVRKTEEGGYQAGFCEPLEGVPKASKVKSLADAIAATAKAPWRGVFQLDDDLFWYVAVSDGFALLPDGDRVCTAEQLGQLQAAHKDFFDWREVTGGRANLAELAQAGDEREALRDFDARFSDRFSIRPKTAVIAGALVTLATAGVGGAAYVHQQREAEIQAAIDKRRSEVAAQAELDAALKPPAPPWTTVPNSGAVVEACRDQWSGQTIAKPGWLLATWTCMRTASGLDVIVEWTSDEGRAKDAPGQLLADGKKSTESRSVQVEWVVEAQQLSQSGHEIVELLSVESAARAARDLAQKYGAEVSLVMPQAPKELPGSEKQPVSPYAEIAVTPTLPMAPWFGFAQAFDAVPGLRVSSIKLDMSKDAWEVACQLYASRVPVKGAQ